MEARVVEVTSINTFLDMDGGSGTCEGFLLVLLFTA